MDDIDGFNQLCQHIGSELVVQLIQLGIDLSLSVTTYFGRSSLMPMPLCLGCTAFADEVVLV